MGIKVSTPSGASIEFPDGTDEATIRRVMAQASGGAAPKGDGPGILASAAEGVGQGVTFGFSDELEGAARAGIGYLKGDQRPFGERYDEGVAIPRARQKAAKESNPIAYYGGEIGSAVATPMGAIRAAGKSLGARMVAGSKTGAVQGGLFGLGTAEGDLSERVEPALKSATLGAGVGAALPPIVDIARPVIQSATRAITAARDPGRVASEKVAEALVRDTAPAGAATGREAQEGLQRVHDRLTSLKQATGGSRQVMLADAGGENTRNLFRTASNLPSGASETLRKKLDARQSTQHVRLEDGLQAAIKENPDDFYKAVEGLTNRRSNAAKPAFDEAYSAPWNVKGDDDLAKFLTERSYPRRLLEKTAENVQGTTGVDIAQMRPWELMHRMRMQINREIASLKRGNPDSKANWDMRDLTVLKKEFDGLIGKHNTKMGAAINKYADDSALINAAEDGFEQALKLPVEELRRSLKGLTTAEEQQLWRLGAARALAGKIREGNVMRDRTENIFGSPDMQMRLEAIMPDRKALRNFQRSLIAEAKMADTRKAVQGNSTTAKQLAQADEAGQPVRNMTAIANAFTGKLSGVADAASRMLQRFHGMTPDVANEVVNELMRKTSYANKRAWEAAVARAEQEPAYRAKLVQRMLKGASAGIGSGMSEQQAAQRR